jgi:hypothetical protein
MTLKLMAKIKMYSAAATVCLLFSFFQQPGKTGIHKLIQRMKRIISSA